MSIQKEEIEELSLPSYFKNTFLVGFNNFLDLIPFTFTYLLIVRTSNDLEISSLTVTITCYLFFFGYLNGMQEAMNIRCSKFFGAKDKEGFSASMFRFIIVNTVLVSMSILLVLGSKKLLLACNIAPVLAGNVSDLLYWTLAAKIIETYSNLMKSMLMSQKHFKPFFYLNLTTLFVFLAGDYVFIYLMKLRLLGFVYALTLKIIFEFFVLVYFILTKFDMSYLRCVSLGKLCEEFFVEIKFIFFVSFSMYFEVIGFTITDIFIARLGQVKYIIAWGLAIDISMYFIKFIFATNMSLRTYTSIEIGKKDPEGYQAKKKKCFQYGLFFIFIESLAIILLAPVLSRMYTNDEEVIALLEPLIYLFGLIIYIDFFLFNLSTLLRTIEREFIQFILGTCVNPVLVVIGSYTFIYVLDLNVIGARLSFFVSEFTNLILVYLIIRYYEPGFLKKIEKGQLVLTDEEESKSLLRSQMRKWSN